MLEDCDSGQVVEALECLTKGNLSLFYLKTGDREPLRMSELERENPYEGWAGEICTSV